MSRMRRRAIAAPPIAPTIDQVYSSESAVVSVDNPGLLKADRYEKNAGSRELFRTVVQLAEKKTRNTT